MGGKALLFVIMGFSLTFLIIGSNYNRLSTNAVSNMSDYATRQISHNIAVAGANLACNAIFLAPTWMDGYSDLSFQGGTIDVTVSVVDAGLNIRRVVSISSLGALHDTVIITFQPSRFSKFAYYSVSEGGTIYWSTGDTVKGPLHTQDYLRVNGRPIFWGKATTKLGLIKKNSSDSPQFLGGYQSGVDLPINTAAANNLETFADVGGEKITGHDTVYMTFITDSVKIKYTWKGAVTTSRLSVLAPNGVIYVKNGTARLQGTIQGQYTIGCGTTSSKGGSIYLDGDLVYKTNPVTNPSSTDILGIVAQKNIWLTDNAANNSGGIKLNGSYYAQTGSFGAENYSTRPIAGVIDLTGGIIQATRGAVGTLSGTTINHGFNKSYKYDTRMMFSSPPNFPNTGSYEIISWYE